MEYYITTIRSDIYADILPNQGSWTAIQAFVWREAILIRQSLCCRRLRTLQ